MPKYDGDTIPTCVLCDKKDQTKICKKCSIVYCKHYASKTDLRYCANCISDFALRETIMEKQVEHVTPDGAITFSRKYQARHITLSGTDWLFQAALIPEMTDAEIEASVEYHRANIGIMLQERESRKLERIRKLSGIKVPKVIRESQEQKEKREAREATKGSKTKVTDKNMSADQVMAAIAKSGISPQALMEALKGMK